MSYIEKLISIFLLANVAATLFNIMIAIYIIQKLRLDQGRILINERYQEKVKRL